MPSKNESSTPTLDSLPHICLCLCICLDFVFVFIFSLYLHLSLYLPHLRTRVPLRPWIPSLILTTTSPPPLPPSTTNLSILHSNKSIQNQRRIKNTPFPQLSLKWLKMTENDKKCSASLKTSLAPTGRPTLAPYWLILAQPWRRRWATPSWKTSTPSSAPDPGWPS